MLTIDHFDGCIGIPRNLKLHDTVTATRAVLVHGAGKLCPCHTFTKRTNLPSLIINLLLWNTARAIIGIFVCAQSLSTETSELWAFKKHQVFIYIIPYGEADCTIALINSPLTII